MRFRDHVALTLPALILRLILCVTFLWAGLGKILGEMTVTGDDAARLTQMGFVLDSDQPATPLRPLSDAPPGTDAPGDTVSDPVQPQNPPTEPPTDLVIPETGGNDSTEGSARMPDVFEPVWTTVQGVKGTVYSAQDFPGSYTVQRVAGVALLLSRAGDPGLDAESKPIPSTMPAWVAAESWPRYLAWAAAVTELLAAIMLFFGVLTRLGGLMLAGVMVVAMWLTQFGPAIMEIRPSYLGVIPAAEDPWSPQSYATLLWQLSCFVMAMAVFMLGSGPIGFDRALFRPTDRLERTEPKRARSTFDRGPSDEP